MTNDLHQADENTGTMEVLDRHQFDIPSLENYMQEHVEGFEGKISVEEFKGGQSNPTYKVITRDNFICWIRLSLSLIHI